METPPLISLEDVRRRFCVGPDAPLREALKVMDVNGEGVVLVVDRDMAFQGIVTDGDVRRATLAGLSFEERVDAFLKNKPPRGPARPLASSADAPPSQWARLMDGAGVRHLPLLDENGCVQGLVLMSQMAEEAELPLRAAVMAGGFGVRLRPLTSATPKPLLPIGDKPLIERIIDQLRDSGVRRVNITTHFKADKIKDHFGDGGKFGVEVGYTDEDQPLGTAGALAKIKDVNEPLLVINGDVLTGVDFRAMLEFHKSNDAKLTVGVRKYDMSVPYGVVEVDGARVARLSEKQASFFINAGIYILEPSAVAAIPEGERFDMTDLIDQLLAAGEMVASFPIHEYWLDIGQVEDYTQAFEDAKEGKLKP